MNWGIGIDLGGTNVKAVAVTSAGEVLGHQSVPTRDGVATIENWADAVRLAIATFVRERGAEPAAVGMCMPGLVAADGRSIASYPGRLRGLEGFDWPAALNRPRVPLLNDAHAALLAEAWLGAAKGRRHAILLTLGTGVGGAILADGRLLRGALGRAGHLGHMSVDHAGPASIVGMPGAIEVMIGECTLPERGGGRFADTQALVAAYLAGDHEAAHIWLKSVRALACAIASAINVLDPEIVVLGGGIAKAGEALFRPLRDELAKVEWRPTGQGVPVVPAVLGDGWEPLGRLATHYTMMSPAETYLARSRDLLATVSAQLPAIATAADWFAQTILAGRMVHVFGSGHSRIMVEEMWPRYGSFPGFNPIVELSLSFHNLVVGANGQRQAMFLENVSGLAERILRNFALDPRDTAFVISSSGCNVVPIEMAEEFRRRHVRVVALVSRAHADASVARRADGKKLTDFADLVLDTGAPVGDAMVTVDGLDTPVAPGSTVGGCLVVNAIKAEVALLLTAAGQPPKVLSAAAVVGSARATSLFEAAYDEHAHRLARLYADAGPA